MRNKNRVNRKNGIKTAHGFCGCFYEGVSAVFPQEEKMMSENEKPQRKGIGCGGWIGLIILGIVGLLYVYWPSDEQMAQIEKEKAAENQAAVLAKRESAIKVTASEMFSTFQENEIAALARFKGSAVRVSGTVDGVDADFSDDPVIKLKTNNQFMPVQVSLDKGQSDFAAQLSKGSKAEFICDEVSEVAGTPMLDSCAPL